MNWDALSAMAETAGVIGLLVSLIYLSVQIRLNTRQIADGVESSRLSAFERNVESGNRLRELLILNPDLLELYLRGCQEFEALGDLDAARFGLLVRNLLSAVQGAYVRQLSLSHDPDDLRGLERVVDELIANPGIRQFLSGYEPDWRPEFRAFMKARIARIDDGDQQQNL